MTQLGCNYSHVLLDLLAAGEVAIDWIKLSRDDTLEAEIAQCRPVRPCLVHTLPRCGQAAAEFRGADWPRFSRALLDAGSPHVALHLEVRAEDGPDPVARMIDNLKVAQAQLPVPVLIENTVYRAGGEVLKVCCEPATISRVMAEAGVGLLLDTAHLRCSAHNMGLTPEEYCGALPLDQVREIHVAGIRRLDDGQLNDSHQEIEDADYALLAWLLERTAPLMVTLEYGGVGSIYDRPGMTDRERMRRQLRRLKEMLA
jgi:uncharacterized protein (UPF0276 family)